MRLTPTRAFALGLALLAVLIAVELATGVEPLTATFMLPAFLAALAARPPEVAAVGVLGITAAIVTGLVAAGEVAADAYSIRTAAVVLGVIFAVFAALQRERAATAAAELDAALGNLADAVTVQDSEGNLVYANNAAAALLGFATGEELLATPPEEIVARYESFTEDGRPLDPQALPGRQALRGEDPRPLLVRAVNRETGEERWQMVKATATPAPDGGVRATNVIEDVTESKRAEIAQRLLAQAGDTLGSSLDYAATLQEVAQLAVPTFADWCGVSMPREDGVMEQVAVAHADPEKVRMAQELSERYPSRIDDPGTAMIVDAGRATLLEISDELLRQTAKDEEHHRLLVEVGLRSAIGVPMFAGDEFLGTISFVTSDEAGRRLTENDLPVADELGRRASVAIQNARLFAERSHAARTLEQALRPPELPAIPGWRAATMYEPASEGGLVGGDFYDAFEGREGWVVVIGDVGGRGVDAAALTAMARYTLRTASAMSEDPLIAFDRLNAWMLERDEVQICTAAIVHLGAGGRVRLCSAGHPPPLVVAGGRARPWGPRGSILGAFEETAWEVEERMLGPGEKLVLYTDGLFELSGGDGRLGEERLAGVFDGVDDPEGAVHKAHAALHDFAAGRFTDDMAMVVLEREE